MNTEPEVRETGVAEPNGKRSCPVLTCQLTPGRLERQLEELLVQLKHFGLADDLREAVIHVMHLHETNNAVESEYPTFTFSVRNQSREYVHLVYEPRMTSIYSIKKDVSTYAFVYQK